VAVEQRLEAQAREQAVDQGQRPDLLALELEAGRRQGLASLDS
jgi:hypothetical protein